MWLNARDRDLSRVLSAMQFFVRHPVVRPVVKALFRRQLHAIDKFHVGTFVNFVRMAGGEIGDEKADRAAGFWRQRLAAKSVNNKRAVHDNGERDAGVKIVGR
jgi:hypothetical protein